MVANKRMININLVDSDKFLEMPPTTQNLYFHLCVRADDDGFVNSPRRIQRTVCANDDDLKLLIAKEYVIPFESGVIVITHWKIHNTIQKDRYHTTQYENELRELTTKKNGEYTFKNSLDTKCIQNVSKLETELDKTRLDKTRLDKTSTLSKVPYQRIINLYNEICSNLPKVVKSTENRKKTVQARFKEYDEDVEVFKRLFNKANESDFLCGKNERQWHADFDWLLNQQNMAKVLEDRYINKCSSVDKVKAKNIEDFGPITVIDDNIEF